MTNTSNNQIKPRVFRAWVIFSTTWVVLSAPLVATFFKSEYLRFVFYETVAGYWQKFDSPRFVFVGDSITATGRNWGLRLYGNPLISRTFAADGYTTRQIQSMAGRAAALNPEWIFVMAGTNDVTGDDYALEATVARFRHLLETAQSGGAGVVVTLALYQQDHENNLKIGALNKRIVELADEMQVEIIDLNPVVAPEEVLLDKFTDDGVHPSARGLKVWADAIRELVNSKT